MWSETVFEHGDGIEDELYAPDLGEELEMYPKAVNDWADRLVEDYEVSRPGTVELAAGPLSETADIYDFIRNEYTADREPVTKVNDWLSAGVEFGAAHRQAVDKLAVKDDLVDPQELADQVYETLSDLFPRDFPYDEPAVPTDFAVGLYTGVHEGPELKDAYRSNSYRYSHMGFDMSERCRDDDDGGLFGFF